MELSEQAGREVWALVHVMKRSVEMKAYNVSGTQGMVMCYLMHEREREIFQRDLERVLGIRRSTVTGILDTMEKNGLITRTNVEHDKRLKRIELTEAGEEMYGLLEKYRQQTDRLMCDGVSQRELESFIATAKKLRQNIQKGENA